MKKLVYLGLAEVQTVKIIFAAYVGRVFENLKKRKCNFSRDLEILGVS